MKALVLSSGGVDSTVCLAIAVQKYGAENVCALSVSYGQKHSRELNAAKKLAEYYEGRHWALVYGDQSKKIAAANDMLGIENVII